MSSLGIMGGFFMAGCIQEKSYRESYESETAAVKQSFSYFSPHDVRVEVARRFKIRYAIDHASETKDITPTEEVTESISFTLQNGQIFYPTYGEHGTYLDSLHQNQKNHSDTYSLSDHQTSRLAEEAFRNGATKAVLSYAREGEANRDLLVMTYDPKTKEGKTFVVNTALDGKQHSYDAIIAIGQKLFENLSLIQPTNTSAILTDTLLSSDHAREAVTRLTLDSERIISQTPYTHPVSERLIPDSVTTVEYSAIKIAGDIRETWVDIRDFFNRKLYENEKKRRQDILLPEFGLQIEQTQSGEQKEQLPTKGDVQTAIVILSEPRLLTLKEPFAIIGVLFALDTIANTQESVHALEEKEQPQLTDDDVETAIAIFSEPTLLTLEEPVVTIGILFAIDTFAHMPKESVRKEDRVTGAFVAHTTRAESQNDRQQIEVIHQIGEKLTECVISQHPFEETLDIPDSETMGFFNLYRFFYGEKKKLSPEEHEVQKEEARESIKRFLALTTPEEQQKYKTLERFALLYIALAMRFIKPDEIISKKIFHKLPPTFSEKNIQKKLERDMPIARLSQLLTLLFLFSYASVFDRLFQNNKDVDLSGKRVKKQNPEKNISSQLERTPWILLSIIWYLAMIREQGVRTNSNPQKNKRKKKNMHSILPVFGVIFTF